MDPTPLLQPRSIAVVGATDRRDSYGDTILRNLERVGFEGSVWGVNPRRDSVHGVECVPAISDLPEPVDAVAIAIPAVGVPDAISAAAEKGCGGAVVVSAGFGEVESGRELEQRLAAAAQEGGIPVCGPNGNGVVALSAGAAIWGDSLPPLVPGRVALISQSGNVAVNALGSRRGTGFHTVVSTGNGTVCDATDWLLAVAERKGVRSIGLFLESDGDGAKLAEGLARCAERDVRVVVLKVGSSAAGAGAATAHTGALAGDQRIFRSLIEEAGGSWARNPHELLELSRVLAEPRARSRGAGGLGILTCSGGDSGIAADEAERYGVELPPLQPETASALRDLLPEAATVANPLDYTSLIWAETDRLRQIVAAVGNDPGIDRVLVFHDTPAELSEEAEAGWRETRAGLIAGACEGDAAPLFASTLPDLINGPIVEELGEAGVASVAGLTTAILCARELAREPGDPARLRQIAGSLPIRPIERDVKAARWLGEAEAKEMLRDAGIAVPPGRVVLDSGDAVKAVAELRYPVALKLSSPEIQHKSDLGAIELGVGDDRALLVAVERLRSLPAARGAQLLLESMLEPGVELLVAARADAVVPALVIGLGGLWTEALEDVAVIPLPASAEAVERGLRSLRGAPLLTGGRGRDGVDLGAVAQAAATVGELVIERGFELIELNPLIASASGCVAADATALTQ